METINEQPKVNKPIIISGKNGSGKTTLLEKLSKELNYHLYKEKYTNGIDRKQDILEVALMNDKLIIDNIELYLDSDYQETIINDILKLNPKINLICSTHSPSIIINGWFDCVFEIETVEDSNSLFSFITFYS